MDNAVVNQIITEIGQSEGSKIVVQACFAKVIFDILLDNDLTTISDIRSSLLAARDDLSDERSKESMTQAISLMFGDA